jgi:hypothetical protein
MPRASTRRVLGRYDLEGGSFIEIACTGDVDTATAIDVVSTLIDLKRAELKKQAAPKQLPMLKATA